MRISKNLYAACLLFSTCFAYAEDLKIGATLSLTGAYANYGRQALNGATLAVEEANAHGGVAGKKVRLLVEDFGTLDLKRAATAAQKLIEVDKVDIFLPMIVEDSEVIVPITSRIPMFSMAIGCGARTCAFNMGQYHTRAPSSHDAIVETLVQHAKNSSVKNVCILAAEATYFEGYGRYIEELSKKIAEKVLYVSVPLSNSEDYRDVAVKFKQNKCDAIFSWIPIGSSGGFFRRVREVGSQALIYGIVETDDPSILKTAGSAAEGVFFARFSLGSKEFQDRYELRFKEKVSRPAIPSYDGVKLLLKLIEKVGTNPDKLKAALVAVQNQPAENGSISYSKEGERTGEAVELMQIKGGVAVSAKF